MTDLKKYFFIIIISIAFSMLVVFLLKTDEQGTNFNLEVVKTSNGWMYNIRRNNKMYINQQYVPAVQGRYVFANRISAERTGQLVLSKLKQKKLPFVTLDELIAIGAFAEGKVVKLE